MRRIIAIVEGQTEEHFIKRTYASALVLRPFTNGRDVPLKVIAQKIAKPLAKIGTDFDDTIVLLDRERRDITSEELRAALALELSELCPGREFSIGVPDIHIENWILADEPEMKKRFDESFIYAGDGTAAKSTLREISGVSHSPLAKAELLKACCSAAISANSPSFQSFRDTVKCSWPWIKKAA